MTTILNGLIGGLLVGSAAAAAARAVADEPSAAAAALARTVGPRVSPRRTELVVHLAYGCLAGGALVALELFALGMLAVPPTTGEAIGVAVAWSALLFGALAVVRRVASRPFDRSRLGRSLAYHLVYGLGLGVWIRATWMT